LIINYQIDLW